MPKEPQSYGSEKDWLTGNVGETVNDQKSEAPPEESEFYDDQRASESSGTHTGGHVSAFDLKENAEPVGYAETVEDQPVSKVSDQSGGAKRGGFFKDRDYKS